MNLDEAAEYMFDHNIFQDDLVGVALLRADGQGNKSRKRDKCAVRLRRRTPTCTATAPCPGHDPRSNPFTGAFYLEALQMSRMTREMFCLMEGRRATSFHAVSRRRRRVPPSSLHRLHSAAYEIRGVHEEGLRS